jgi:hypothetical protein
MSRQIWDPCRSLTANLFDGDLSSVPPEADSTAKRRASEHSAGLSEAGPNSVVKVPGRLSAYFQRQFFDAQIEPLPFSP